MDTGAAFTGGAGNDTLVATVATMGSLDVVDGGAGTDTISITESVDVASLPGTYTGFETLTISTTGAIGATNTTAGTASATSTAQVVDFTLGTPSATTQNYTVTIGGVAYTTQNVGTATAAYAWTAIKKLLQDKLGNAVSFDDTNYMITANNAGQPLPSISIALNSSGTGTASIAAAASGSTTANVTAKGAIAMKQVESITFADSTSGTATSDDLAAGDVLTLNIGGVDYPFASSGTTSTTLATDVAAVINSVLGTGVAVATSGTVIVTAPTAGTALPTITLDTGANKATAVAGDANDWSATVTQIVANQTIVTAAASAGAVAAPTGVTTYNATASGVANVSGSATAKLVVSGTTVQTSGGLDVTVTGTKAVGVSGAKGAVSITTSNAGSSTAGEVITNAGTGAATTTYGSGIYVTGGTTVGITQTGATITDGVAGTIRSSTIQVGVNPTAALNAATSGTFAGAAPSPAGVGYNNVVGGLAGDPTGDVTITTQKTYTTAAGKSAIAYGTGNASVYTNGSKSVSITGVTTGTVTDVNTTFVQASATDSTGAVAGASKLETVSLTGAVGTSTIKSDAISTVNVSISTSATVEVSNSGTTGANSGTFNVNVGNSTVTVNNATTTAVNVGSTTSATYDTIDGTAPLSASSTLTLNAAKATSLNFTNASKVTLSTGAAGLAKVATITASGAGDLTADVSDATKYAKLVTVDASAKTGKVALTLNTTPADAGQVVKTGSGDDTVTLKGAIGSTTATAGGLVTTTIDLGAGNDKLAYVSGGSVAAGASIDAGAGTDTVDALLVNVGNSAIFKNFERVNIGGVAGGGAFDASVLSNSTIDGITIGADLASGSAYSVTNLAGTTATVTVAPTLGVNVSGDITATLASSAGTADVMNINFASSNTLTGTPALTTKSSHAVNGITTTGIETVNVSSAGSITNTINMINSNLILNQLKLFTDTTNVTSSIVITGSKEFTLGDIAATRDSTTQVVTAAGTMTADGVYQNKTVDSLDTATADVAAALKTIDASATTGGVNIWAGKTDALTGSWNQKYDGLVISGGTGSDFIRNSAKLGVTTGGAGNDWLIVDGLTGSADGGAGDDTLVANAGVAATLTGGAGKDTFDVTAATMAASGHAALTVADTLLVTTITDFATGDILKFGPTTLASGVLVDGTTTVASATSLFAALDAALKISSGTAVGTDVSVWFVYGGNTYIAHEADNSYDGLTGDDIVVKLTGIHTLSASAVTTPATGLFGEA